MPQLLDDDPSDLLLSLTENFDTTNDLKSLSRISSTLSSLHTHRSTSLDSTRSTLRLLSRKAEIATTSLESSLAAREKRNHPALMDRLESEKFSLAKAVNEAESETHRLEGELARLREELERVEAEDVERVAVGEDEGGEVLKLKVYRSLGIELEEDEKTGEVKKAIVRNPRRGDVSVIKIEDQAKNSPAFYADFFWKQLA